MLSEEANTKGPQLVNITHAVLHNMGIQIDDSKMSNSNQQNAESSFVDVIEKVQSPALEIMKKNSLNFEQMAQSAAIATAFIIQQSANIAPEQGFGTAIYHFIEGTKTLPPQFGSSSDKTALTEMSKDNSKPWWKFW